MSQMPTIVVNTTEIAGAVAEFGVKMMALFISCGVSWLVAYIVNNIKLHAEAAAMRELKAKQVELHKEGNDIQRNTPKSASPSS